MHAPTTAPTAFADDPTPTKTNACTRPARSQLLQWFERGAAHEPTARLELWGGATPDDVAGFHRTLGAYFPALQVFPKRGAGAGGSGGGGFGGGSGGGGGFAGGYGGGGAAANRLEIGIATRASNNDDVHAGPEVPPPPGAPPLPPPPPPAQHLLQQDQPGAPMLSSGGGQPQWGLGEGEGSGSLADELGVLTLAHEGVMMREGGGEGGGMGGAGEEAGPGQLQLVAAADAAAERLHACGGAPARALAVVDQLCALANAMAEQVGGFDESGCCSLASLLYLASILPHACKPQPQNHDHRASPCSSSCQRPWRQPPPLNRQQPTQPPPTRPQSRPCHARPRPRPPAPTARSAQPTAPTTPASSLKNPPQSS
jgi:hypothetical protein